MDILYHFELFACRGHQETPICPDSIGIIQIYDGRLICWTSRPAARRQECRPAYSRDGTVYITRREIIEAGSLYGNKCVPLIIPHGESVNIDSEQDWERAEAMKGKANG